VSERLEILFIGNL